MNDPCRSKVNDLKRKKIVKSRHDPKVTEILKKQKSKYAFINSKKMKTVSNEQLLQIQDENLQKIKETENTNKEFWEEMDPLVKRNERNVKTVIVTEEGVEEFEKTHNAKFREENGNSRHS